MVNYGSLKDDLAGLRRGLVGTLNLGVIPAAMSAVSFRTVRFAEAHPAARVEIRSMTSRAIERAVEAFEIDAGLTYLENEPLQHVRRLPLYRERYVLVTRRGHLATANATIAWKDAAAQRLCLLSEDMQNRRIINKLGSTCRAASAIATATHGECRATSFRLRSRMAGSATAPTIRTRAQTVKLGFTPNATDEYSISCTAQTVEKGAPLHVYNNPPNPPNSYWRWPTWDIGKSVLIVEHAARRDSAEDALFHNTYALLNVEVQYRGGDSWELAAGGTNLADENFELAQGFPEEGRSYYVRARLTF